MKNLEEIFKSNIIKLNFKIFKKIIKNNLRKNFKIKRGIILDNFLTEKKLNIVKKLSFISPF